MEIYLDNSATTRVRNEIINDIVMVITENYGNPSSLHHKGFKAEKILNYSREMIARLLKCSPEEIYFTSGGTESNNLAIRGYLKANRRKGNHIITTAIEHPSVSNTFLDLKKDGYNVDILPVNPMGYVNIDDIKRIITEETALISIMMVNNEIGTIEPIKEISAIAKEKGVALHVDAVQGFGKLDFDVKEYGIDMLSLSGHKIYGLKGSGALYVGRDIKIAPILTGGGQERDIRSGTENMPGIIALGKAAELLFGKIDENARFMYELKKKLVDELKELDGWSINGPGLNEAAPHILNISFSGIRGEVLVHSLEEYGIYVSTGSACSSKHHSESPVLKALGLKPNAIQGAIRISFSIFNTEEEVVKAAEAIKKIVPELRKYTRR
ncbi:MAG: cysteine desulfurase family protein [Thermoanaerobacteraceae bacterium]|nr:cysteine desulfurase family protein [Thermoanaerobacteraceae bacterium]